MVCVQSDVEMQGVMHIEPTLVLHVEMCDVAVCFRCGEEVVSSCGLLGAWSSACVVVGDFMPLMCLAAHINKLVGVKGMLEGLEGGWVTIKIAYNKSGSCWLKCHVSKDSLHHVVGP